MPTHPAYLVDEFTSRRFAGNQAAVCLVPYYKQQLQKLEHSEYQKIAAEFNLSETAFPLPLDGDFKTASKFSLRWFTPKTEVPLCGHATLATSHVLLYIAENKNDNLTFCTQSGNLIVSRSEGKVLMNFPKFEITSVRFPHSQNSLASTFDEFTAPHFLSDVIGCLVPSGVRIENVAYAAQARKLIVVIDPSTTRFELEHLDNQLKKMVELHPEGDFVRGIIVSLAPQHPAKQGFVDEMGVAYDYVCRYFAPWVGIDEDPATGSAQCALAPFWATILNKNQLYALQSFPGRGAQFNVELGENGRVNLRGTSVTVMEGFIHL